MTSRLNVWNFNAFGEEVEIDTKRRFSKEESQQVRAAVEEVCVQRNVDPQRLCSECQHKPEFRGIWVEIAKQFPEFRVQAVYRHAIRLFHPFQRGAWGDSEVDRLIELVGKYGRRWAYIQSVLDRDAEACRDKYRECRKNLLKGRWSEIETAELEKMIRDFLKAPANMTMKEIGKMVFEEDLVLPWSTFASNFGNRSRLSCFKKFEKLAGLYIEYHGGCGPEIRLEKRRAILGKEKKKMSRAPDFCDITGDPDMYLLSELAQSGSNRASEVPWETLRVEGAQEKWNLLILEWQQQEGDEATEEPLTTLPLCELAQLLLDRKTNAKIAAQTVEAIDLPVV